MNKLTTINRDPEDPNSSSASSTQDIRSSKHSKSLATRMKAWIKKLPYFWELDYFRRKVYDSPAFDFTVKPLADSLSRWPGALLIDVTNRCNAKCVWCPNPDLTEVGSMKMNLYRKIIDDYATRGGMISFGTFGEPLMDKTFREKIEYLQKVPRIHKTEVLTNGFFLNDAIRPVLIENSVAVDISLDELDKDTFENVKKMSFEVVRDNILEFLHENSQASQPVPVNIRIKTLKTMEATLNNDFFRALNDYDCSIALTPINDNIISNWAGMFDKDNFLKEYSESGPASSIKFNHKRFNSLNKAPCTQLWKWMVVYWDGSVVLCCADMFAQSTMGNLSERSIEDIWSGPELTKVREQMIARQRFEIPLCQNCDIHLSWHNLQHYYDSQGNFRSGNRFIIG